jgi:hypothetical protein
MIVCQVVELDAFFSHCITLVASNAFKDTGIQMAFHQQPFELLDGFAYRIGLPQDSDTLFILCNPFARCKLPEINDSFFLLSGKLGIRAAAHCCCHMNTSFYH